MIKYIGGPIDGYVGDGEWVNRYLEKGIDINVIWVTPGGAHEHPGAKPHHNHMIKNRPDGRNHPYFRRSDSEYVSGDVDINVLDQVEFSYA